MGKSKGEHRVNIELKCPECGYTRRPTEKNKQNTPDKMEENKYCPVCHKNQKFKEKK